MVSETCTDTGGGFNMGYAAPNDYLDYFINVSKAGYYNVNYRVASEKSSSQIVIRVGEGNSFTPIDTVTINGTGGWQTWKTIQSKLYLEAGRYTLRMFVKSGEFNINWFEFVAAPVTAANDVTKGNFRIYPNPASDFTTVDLSGLNNDVKLVQIFDTSGNLVKSYTIGNALFEKIDVRNFTKGVYFLVVSSDKKQLAKTKLVVE